MTDKKWGTKVEREVKKRIKLLVAAYAYEFEADSIISDAEFDKLALEVDKSIRTGRTHIDRWFIKNFQPDTGSWIHAYPDLDSIEYLYRKFYKR